MCYEIQSQKNPGIYRMKQLDGHRFIIAFINTMDKLLLNQSYLCRLYSFLNDRLYINHVFRYPSLQHMT